MNHKCEACRFWKAQTDERDMGECRRRAPAPARAVLVRPGDPPVSWAASWPVTGA